MGGGVQVVLNEQGSWSEMANQSKGMITPTDENSSRRQDRPSGMLGFLGRKKGRDRSPKAKEKPTGWLYMGSHNFTPSAWGTLSGTAFNPTLNVRML